MNKIKNRLNSKTKHYVITTSYYYHKFNVIGWCGEHGWMRITSSRWL
jgi:hypothetical protein